MAWNIPGKKNGDRNSGGERPNPWPPRRRGSGGGGNGPLDGILDPLKRMFGEGGGGPLRWIGILLALWLVFNCFVLIGEQQRGVVLRFGHVARIMQPGPNFKAPWPIERVNKVDFTNVRDFSNTVPVLTRDENIVVVSLNVQYNVADAELYLFGTRDAERTLEQVAQSVVREQVGRADLDTVLGARGPLSAEAKSQLQQSLDIYRTGLFVTQLNLQDARPPEEVKPAFDDVNSAQQAQESLVNEAQAYAARIVPEARGAAARTRTVAEGYKTAAIARATGDAERFTLLVDEYRGAPEVTRKRLWLETVEQVVGGNRTVVGGDGRQLIYVPMTGQAGATPGRAEAAAPPVLPAEVVSPTVEADRNAGSRLPRPTREGDTR